VEDAPARPEINILGAFEARADGAVVRIGAARLRALVAVLALGGGSTVSVDGLIDGTWGERPPASARELVRLYVSQLRAALGEHVIATRTGGYALAETVRIDAAEFEALVASARGSRNTGSVAEALGSYEAALQLWRGELLVDAAVEGSAQLDASLLEELHLTALEERFDVALALGQSTELIPDLERAVDAAPLRERFRAQLMLALYRSGRQAEALAAYRTARAQLHDELGLEPGSELRDLEAAILRHDPALATPAPPASVSRSRRRIGSAAAIALAVAVAALALLLGRGSGGSTNATALGANELGELDPHTGAVLATTKVSPLPAGLTVAAGEVDIVSASARTLATVDARTLRAERTVGLGAVPHALAYGDGATWIANGYDGTLTRVGDDGLVTAHRRPEPRSTGRLALAFGGGSLWVGSLDNAVSRLDPIEGRPAAVIRGVVQPWSAAFGFHALWVAQATRANLVRIDPATNRIVKRIPVGGPATSVATGAGAVWVLTPNQQRLWRIDPQNNAVTAAASVGDNASLVVAGPHDVWVIGQNQGLLAHIDPHTNTVDRTIQLGRPIGGAVLADHKLWIATQ
jgi:DNA-binding SARP family transcriptional activator